MLRNKRASLAAFAALALVVCAGRLAFAADPQYKAVTEIAVGGLGGWDYLSAEPVNHRLYVSHGTKVVVIDTESNKLVGEILDTPGVHGFVAIPDLKLGYSSNGQEAKASMVDLETLKTTMKVPTGKNPDAILYEPKSGEVWTFNGKDNTATAFDAKTGKVIADAIPVAGKPETGVADATLGRVFVNIEDKDQIDVIDTKTHKVVEHWPVDKGTGGTGLAYDPELHRLIIGGGGSSKMIMMDSTNGKVVASIDAAQGIDAAAVDPTNHLAFVSGGGSGTVTIARIEADKLTPIQTLTTERGARTMTIDTRTHRIYLANAKSRTDATSFKVLVYGIDGK
jgi:DNA-binding beta-propeller fold protein YncE